MSGAEDFYWYWLCNISGIGSVRIRNLMNIFGTPEEIYKASDKVIISVPGLTQKNREAIIASRRDSGMYTDFVNLQKKRIRFIHMESREYPSRLKEIYDCPAGIYCKGKLPQDERPSVAIIGARNCTPYGKSMAYEFSKAFAQYGMQVISGMALGIDSAGHEGCLDGGGYTCAVLGCGVDICYPACNIEMYSIIEERGGIISEYAAGTKPSPGQFPVRNRIISGLADVVIVVEARRKSGSLITVDQALEQNKDIMVVPGRIGDALSEGCNNLIKLGAQVITEPKDIFDNTIIRNLQDKLINLEKNNKIVANADNMECFEHNINEKPEHSTKITLATPKDMLYSCLNLYPKTLDEITQEMGIDITVINGMLIELQLDGRIEEVSKNCYIRKHM